MPLVIFRRFNQLMGAIRVQVEDEFTCREVMDTVCVALTQQAETIREPERAAIWKRMEECRQEINKRLNWRQHRQGG